MGVPFIETNNRESDVIKWVGDNYEIHDNSNRMGDNIDGWFLMFETIYNSYNSYLQMCKFVTKTVMGRELKKIGLFSKDKKLDGKYKKVYICIRKLSQ
tara:strand:- start:2814 stop:3107 length:294 start_codon:yes stop_codon:yes gene_type:complete